MAFSGSRANRQNGEKRDGFGAVIVRVGDCVEGASVNRVIVTRGPPVPVHGLQDPVRPETLTVYDAGGNVLQVTDPKGNVTDNTYDALGRLISTKTYPDTGETIEVKFQHDDAGNRFKVTDANDFTTVFHYDGLNRNTKLVHPNQDEKVFTYDAVHMLSRTDENGASWPRSSGMS